MMDLRTAARLLGGDVAGRDRILCPGPGHSPRDRSLSVIFSAQAPDGFGVSSFAGDDWQTCKDYVRERLGLDRSAWRRPAPVVTPAPRPVRSEPSDGERTTRALSFWHAGKDIAGTPAEAYLRRRGVYDVLPVEADGGALRWHDSGMMVALVRDVRTDEPKAVHRTFIGPDGSKATRTVAGRETDRATLGPIGGGAIKLTENADVTSCLAIGEGIESALSVRRLPDLENMPVWSLIMAGNLEGFPVLKGIEGLWIAVDHDASGRGQTAATTAGERWRDAGADVRLVEPLQVGTDLNDLLTMGGDNAAS